MLHPILFIDNKPYTGRRIPQCGGTLLSSLSSFFCSSRFLGFGLLAGAVAISIFSTNGAWPAERFGTLVTWFLLGGDLYTAYTFIAVPGSMYLVGAVSGFFAVPYTVLIYPLIFVLMPRFWSVCKQHGYVTASDFVKDRFGSRGLALAIAFTGILATMPYIALQMFGIQISIAALGIPLTVPIFGLNVDIPLIIAFLILAAYTYTSGLRAPAMIAMVKDLMIFAVLIVAIIYIPAKLGGFGTIFNAAHQKALTVKTFNDLIGPNQGLNYVTLALGSALALFLYPHSLTGVLSSSSQRVVKRNAALLRSIL